MDTFNEVDQDTPSEVELIGRDPLEQLAYKLVDPTLQYLHASGISYSYVEESLEDGTPCHSNLMSLSWAQHTEADIK